MARQRDECPPNVERLLDVGVCVAGVAGAADRAASAALTFWPKTPLIRSADVARVANAYTGFWDLSHTSLR